MSGRGGILDEAEFSIVKGEKRSCVLGVCSVLGRVFKASRGWWWECYVGAGVVSGDRC